MGGFDMYGRVSNPPVLCIAMPYHASSLPDLRGAACSVLQGLQGGGLIHPRAPEQVDGGGADLADEDADPELVTLLQDLGGGLGGLERPPAGLFRSPRILPKNRPG